MPLLLIPSMKMYLPKAGRLSCWWRSLEKAVGSTEIFAVGLILKDLSGKCPRVIWLLRFPAVISAAVVRTSE